MDSGQIDLRGIDGAFDLQATLESGQTYLWDREDGQMYDSERVRGGDAWYHSVVPPIEGVTDETVAVRVRQIGGVQTGQLEWEATDDAVPLLTHLLRLDDDLTAILDATRNSELLDTAYGMYEGMRLVRDPPFPCLISFICSAQMRVARIHGMQLRLAEQYGSTISLGGDRYSAFPTPETLAARTETELRDLSLGYRAPYVQRTAEMVADGEAHPLETKDMSYQEARDHLTQFMGVGNKVSDCVLLFSLGFLEAVPLDTWIQTAISEYFPECDQGTYAETSAAIRNRFGGEYAGYAQTYVFLYLRETDAAA